MDSYVIAGLGAERVGVLRRVFFVFLTPPGSLEAVEEVNPLDVVRERGVRHQGPVAVDVGHGELEGQLVHAHQLALPRLEDAPCKRRRWNAARHNVDASPGPSGTQRAPRGKSND